MTFCVGGGRRSPSTGIFGRVEIPFFRNTPSAVVPYRVSFFSQVARDLRLPQPPNSLPLPNPLAEKVRGPRLHLPETRPETLPYHSTRLFVSSDNIYRQPTEVPSHCGSSLSYEDIRKMKGRGGGGEFIRRQRRRGQGPGSGDDPVGRLGPDV